MRYNYNEWMGMEMDEGQWSRRGAIGPSPKVNLRLAAPKLSIGQHTFDIMNNPMITNSLNTL